MTSTALHARICKVASDVFGVPLSTLTPSSSPDDVEQWDSLTHLTLAVALESEFQVSLTDDDVMEMQSLSLIEAILIERGVSGGAGA
jgi:acyl carrier protein